MNSSRGLLILEADDFEVSNNVLVHTLRSKYSVVMFYTDTCVQCAHIKPIILKLVGNTIGLQVCMVNVYDQDSKILIQMSQKTSTPLQHVPFIMFYLNGIPFKRFDGQYNVSEFSTFINNSMAEAIKIDESETVSGQIPPYTIGKPNSPKVCYLTYQKAY